MTVALDQELVYPDSDGQPMANNNKQFRWIILIKENLEYLFVENNFELMPDTLNLYDGRISYF